MATRAIFNVYVTVRVETPWVYKLTDIILVSLETHGDKSVSLETHGYRFS